MGDHACGVGTLWGRGTGRSGASVATDLPPRRQRFVEEYLIDLNATQAAIRSGYSPRTANEQGARLLAIVSVREAVDRARAERSARVGLTADRVLEELAAIGFAKLDDFAAWGPGRFALEPSDTVDARAVQEVRVKETITSTPFGETRKVEQGIKLHDKLGTLKLLGQHIGMFPDRHEISGPGGTEIQIKARDYREGLTPFLPPADSDA